MKTTNIRRYIYSCSHQVRAAETKRPTLPSYIRPVRSDIIARSPPSPTTPHLIQSLQLDSSLLPPSLQLVCPVQLPPDDPDPLSLPPPFFPARSPAILTASPTSPAPPPPAIFPAVVISLSTYPGNLIPKRASSAVRAPHAMSGTRTREMTFRGERRAWRVRERRRCFSFFQARARKFLRGERR